MKQNNIFAAGLIGILICVSLFVNPCKAELVGDYRFGPPEPLVNEVANGLPDIVHDFFREGRSPLFTGQEIPFGNSDASANGWALGWTDQIPLVGYPGVTSANYRIRKSDLLDLGGRFTIWMRVLYAGDVGEGASYSLVRLGGSGSDAALEWLTTPDDELLLNIRLSTPDGEVKDYSCKTHSRKLLPRYSRWYDLAITFDEGKVTFYATELGKGKAAKTRSQQFVLGENLKLPQTSGPMQFFNRRDIAIEHLRIYRNEALGAALIRGFSDGIVVPGPKAVTSVTVARNRQLFFDDAVIEKTDTAIQRKFHQVKKYPGNPIVTQTHPQSVEGFGPTFWGSVLYDEQEKLYKMWYQGLTFIQPTIFNHLYAYSQDGINWVKPELGILGPDNRYNPPAYVAGHAGMWLTLRKDPHEPDPAKRYKGFFQHDPLYYVTSPDGLHWKDEGVAAYYTDDTATAMYHPQRKEYLKIGRFCPTGRSICLRLIMTCVSDTPFAKGNCAWNLVMVPDEKDLAADSDMQFYHMTAFSYADAFIGLLGVYHSGPNDGTSETELTYSRDGLNWHRINQGTAFIPKGSNADWDRGFGVLSGTGPLEVGNELWFYYSHYENGHHGPFLKSAIGLAKLRLDGFVSLAAGAKSGSVTTKPFKLAGSNVEINAKGRVKIELLDENDTVVAYSELFEGDDCHHLVKWQKLNNLAKFVGRNVKLRFTLTQADLYAFEVTTFKDN